MEIRAEMVAQVQSVLIEPGTPVAVGDTLAILESMKMEIPVFVEQPGVLREVYISAGDVIQEGDLIAVID